MHNLTLAEIARNLAEKRFSAEELTRTCWRASNSSTRN